MSMLPISSKRQCILLLDTTGQGCHVGLMVDQQCHLLSDHSPQSHAKQLLNLIDRLLSEHQLTPNDLTGIIYTQGPGAFTGIRIGVSVVQGLALALTIPTLGVSSLLALAWQRVYTELDNNPKVLVAIDARMQQVYWAVYQFHRDQPWLTIQEDAVGLPTQFPEYEVCVGDGIPILFSETEQTEEETAEQRDIRLNILWLMVEQGLNKGWLAWTQELALPIYVRPESALIS